MEGVDWHLEEEGRSNRMCDRIRNRDERVSTLDRETYSLYSISHINQS